MCCNGNNSVLVKDYKKIYQNNSIINAQRSSSTGNIKNNQIEKTIAPKMQPRHSKISNHPLFSYRSTMICVFCGGRKCKHEDFTLHKNPAIYGLNSDKIDDNIYASQRPSNSLIEKYNLISKFKELNIGLIVNLQLPGEHAFCGPIDKLDESGFSYSPSLFESEGIHVKLCGWKDMNVPDSLNHMLEIVKEMYYYVHFLNKKILVHCHAGYGRTGIVIACFKIFDEVISAEVAKFEIRQKRPKCIQTKEQFAFVTCFQEYIKRLRGNFNLKERRNIENFLKNQNDLDVGNYNFIYTVYNKSVPVFILYILDAIIDLKNKNNIDEFSLYKCLNGSIVLNENLQKYLYTFSRRINNYNWDILYMSEDLIILCELLYKWLTESVEYVISKEHILQLADDFSNYENILKTCEHQTLVYITNFLSLIHENNNKNNTEKKNDKKTDEETEKQKNLFISKLSKYLLGSKNLDNKEYEKCAEKLGKLIVFLENKLKSQPLLKTKTIKSINMNNNIIGQYENINTEEKENMLVNVYNSLKSYFESKKSNNSDEVKINPNIMYENINNILNYNPKCLLKKIKITNVSNDSKSKISGKDEEIKSIKSINSISRNFRISKLGTVSNKSSRIEINENVNEENISSSINQQKIEKSRDSNIYSIINEESSNNKVINEVEEEKNIPWIREEDC